jgi:predicted transposase
MNLSLQIILLPTPEQASLLIETMEAFNAACNVASNKAFELKTASVHRIQKSCYYDLRSRFNLPAQMAVRVIGKVAEAYRSDKKCQHRFKDHDAMVLDNRLLAYKGMDRVSIATLQGRQVMPFVCGGYGKQKLRRIKGQADLVYQNGKFFLLQNCVFPDQEPFDLERILGVDLGF